MSKQIALLRAVNVGGTGMVSSARLKAFFVALGFDDAVTLLNSGNVVFSSPKRAGAALERRLRDEAVKRLKLETDFIVRDAKEWRAVVGDNPFATEAKSDPGRLVVMALTGEPEKSAIAALQNAIPGRGRIAAHGKELYIVYPDGQGGSKLQAALINRHLGVRGTARNWNTALKLLALVER
jgi:uncharacterized protein (DUF1697 family)